MSLLDNLKKHVKELEDTRKDWRSALGKKHEVAEKMQKPKVRYLTPEEKREKIKNWPKGKGHEMKTQMKKHEENKEFQRINKRAWND